MNPNNEVYLIFSIRSNSNIKEIIKEKENRSTITYKIKYQTNKKEKLWTIFLNKKLHKCVSKNGKIIGFKISLSLIYQFIEKLPKSIKYY